MTKDSIIRLLSELNQAHLSNGLDSLSNQQQEDFYRQLLSFGKPLLEEQRHASKREISHAQVQPLEKVQEKMTEEHIQAGKKFLRDRKVGCLILAGGQGTRLGIPEGKGFASVTPVKKKTLFQLAFEKAHRASQTSGCSLPIAVLTSPLNREPIEKYLQQNAFFGVPKKDVDILVQKMVPFIDQEGNWVLQAPGKLAIGPNGNGEALEILYRSGVWEKWRKEGVEAVQVILIDNPLADPFFYPLVGFHSLNRADVTIMATLRLKQQEKVGVLAKRNGKVAVIEYTEATLPLENYPYANTGIFIFAMDFIKKAAEAPLPWHLSLKKAETIEKEKMLWKAEKFLFDVFPFADNVSVLAAQREDCFAPLKNPEGDDSFESVRAALLRHDREILSRLLGTVVPGDVEIELDPAFYYPNEELRQKWRGHRIPSSGTYVLP